MLSINLCILMIVKGNFIPYIIWGAVSINWYRGITELWFRCYILQSSTIITAKEYKHVCNRAESWFILMNLNCEYRERKSNTIFKCGALVVVPSIQVETFQIAISFINTNMCTKSGDISLNGWNNRITR